jgi:hypothetical protein
MDSSDNDETKNMKTETNSKALTIARTYIKGIADKDIEKIMSVSGNNITCSSPLGEITGLASFRAFHEGFARMIKKITLLAAYGDDEQAVIIYHTETHPVPNSLVAELIAVQNGKMVSTRVIYDATPFAKYAATQPQH